MGDGQRQSELARDLIQGSRKPAISSVRPQGIESSSGSMEQVVLVNCALAAQRAGGCGAVGWRPRHSRCRPSGAKQPT